MASANVQVLNEDGVNATIVASDSDCNNPNGRLTVSATDGVEPYLYKLNYGTFQAISTFNDLSPDNYDITVRDANGCEIELEANIVSYVRFSQIKNIVALNCATSGCHDGSISPNFIVDANVVGRASRIQARTSAGTMSPSSRPVLSD